MKKYFNDVNHFCFLYILYINIPWFLKRQIIATIMWWKIRDNILPNTSATSEPGLRFLGCFFLIWSCCWLLVNGVWTFDSPEVTGLESVSHVISSCKAGDDGECCLLCSVCWLLRFLYNGVAKKQQQKPTVLWDLTENNSARHQLLSYCLPGILHQPICKLS